MNIKRTKKGCGRLFLICSLSIVCTLFSGCVGKTEMETNSDVQISEDASGKPEEKSVKGNSNNDVSDEIMNPTAEASEELYEDTEASKVSYEYEYTSSDFDYSNDSGTETEESVVTEISYYETSYVETEQSELPDTSVPATPSEPSEDIQESKEDAAEESSEFVESEKSEEISYDEESSDEASAPEKIQASLWGLTNKVVTLDNGCVVDRGIYLKVVSEPDENSYVIQWYEDTMRIKKDDVEVFEADSSQEEVILMGRTAGAITKG